MPRRTTTPQNATPAEPDDSHPGRREQGPPRGVQRGHPRLVHLRVRRAHPGSGAGLGGHRQGREHAGHRADRVGQDAGRVPVGDRPAGRGARPRGPEAALPGALRLAAEGAGGRHRAEPALPADRDRARRARPGPARARHRGGGAHRRHRRRRAAQAGRHPPDILITTPESLFLLLTSQAREALRGVETVIVDEVHALAGTKRGAHLALSLERLDALTRRAAPAAPAQRIGLSATVRPAAEVASFLGGARPVTIAHPPSTKQLELSIVVPVEDMTDLDAPRRRATARTRRTARRPPVDLAARRGAGARPDRGAPVHDRVRQLAAAGRAALRPAERAGRRAGRTPARAPRDRERRQPGPPAEIMAQAGLDRRRAPRGRAGAPRLGVPAGAGPDRGGAQGGPAAGRGRHLQPGARHRHGRGRPGHPGRVAALGGQRPAAHRPGRAQRRRRHPRRHLPQVPGRPGPGGGRGPADAGRADRGAAHPPQPAGRARPADRGDDRARRLGRGRPGPGGPPGRAVRQPDPAGARGGARHAGRAVPERGVRRSCGPGWSGTAPPGCCTAARAASGWR